MPSTMVIFLWNFNSIRAGFNFFSILTYDNGIQNHWEEILCHTWNVTSALTSRPTKLLVSWVASQKPNASQMYHNSHSYLTFIFLSPHSNVISFLFNNFYTFSISCHILMTYSLLYCDTNNSNRLHVIKKNVKCIFCFK